MRTAVAILIGAIVVAAPARADDTVWNQQSAYSLTVGQKVLIYALRAKNCGDPAPGYDEIKGKLPKSATGTYSDGGVIQRKSESCRASTRQDWVHARGITFTATKPGTEILRFDRDPISVTVR